MAVRWLPNVEQFFSSLLSLIETAEIHENSGTASFDTFEFLFRRLDAYERTLSTLISRLSETFPSRMQQAQHLKPALSSYRSS